MTNLSAPVAERGDARQSVLELRGVKKRFDDLS